MKLSRTTSVVAAIFLGLSAAFAQQPAPSPDAALKFPACSQSMLVGPKWQAVFPGVYTPGFGWVNFSCPISISSNGSVTPGSCTVATALSNLTVTQPPSGTLTIDRTCNVVGSISYTANEGVFQMQVSLARSINGSRLSGFSKTCYAGICNAGKYFVYPFEMVAGQ